MKIFLSGFYQDQINKLNAEYPKITFLDDINYHDKDISFCDALVNIVRSSADKNIEYLKNKKNIKLKWIHLDGAGIEDYISFMKKNKNIIFTNGKIIQGIEVADHAMALLLALSRRINIICKKKDMNVKFENRPIELRGMRALIIGYGGVGRCLAERAFSFGIKIDILDDDYSPYSNIIDKFYLFEDFENIISNYDILFFTSPLTNKNYKLMNENNINKLKNNSYIINVSRGKLICIESLVAELDKNRIGGVGLDVTDPEPLDNNHKLFNFDNVLITPHIAGISQNLSSRNFELIRNNIRRFYNNSNLINQVSIDRQY